MDGIYNFPFGNLLAAADNIAIGRVFLYFRVPLLRAHFVKPGHAFAYRVKACLLFQGKLVRHQPGNIHADGRSAGKARGLDARCVEKALRCLAQSEIIPVLMGAQAHEGSDHLPQGHVLYTQGRLFL